MSEGAIRAGVLRHRVTIEKNQEATRDRYGQREPADWATVATVWADVRPVAARETAEADAVESRVTHKVLTHYRTDVTASMRCVLGADRSRVLMITDVRDLGGQHRGMQLLCTETEGETDA